MGINSNNCRKLSLIDANGVLSLYELVSIVDDTLGRARGEVTHGEVVVVRGRGHPWRGGGSEGERSPMERW